MLVEVGSICDAQQVFDRLVERNVYSWTSLIAGYVECGEVQHAFDLHQKMREDSVHPSGYTFVAMLKACARLKDTERGQQLHDEIERNGLLESDPFVGNTLVDMYTKCGWLAKAQEVFDKLLVRDVVSWNALIAGYADHNFSQHALDCFEQMQLEGLTPTSVTFICSLKACGSIGAIGEGRQIHAKIATRGLSEIDPFVGNSLVDMYAKCGLLAKAREVFDKVPVRDAVSWTTLIAGYVEHNFDQDALDCLEQMQLEGVSPDVITFVCSLKACASIGAIDKGQEIHYEIAEKGLSEIEPFVGNTLVDMYAKCGLLAKAQEVFDKLPVRDAVSWTALIAGYAEHDLGQDALNCFEQMQLEGVSPDAVTFVCSLKACSKIGAVDTPHLVKAHGVFDKLPVRDAVLWTTLIAGYAEHNLGQDALNCFEQMQLEGITPDAVTFVWSLKACGSIGAIDKGREIHGQIATEGLLEGDCCVGNTLIDMYAKCGLLAEAQEVFDKLPVRDAVSWTALIAGYAEHNLGQYALNCFEQMQMEGICPDAVTFLYRLKACISIGTIDKALEIHAQLDTKGLLESHSFVASTLVDMYAKCGLLAKAQEVFDELLVRDAVSWTALIAGYAEQNLGEDALNSFEQMQLEGVSPDAVTFVCSLKACGSIGATDKVQEIHAQLATKRLLERDPFVASTLVDMYAKCGLLAKAQEVFDKLSLRDAGSWTALISGYARLGDSEDVFLMLDRMRAEDRKPDGVTFLSILTACSHTGLVEKGQMYFEAMSNDYGISPTLEHLNCMVDLLGRAGQLDKAVAMIKKMPVNPDLSLWHTMLGACWKWRNVGLGRWAFEHAVELDKKDAAAYVLMSNIYADAHMEEEAKQVELMRLQEKSWKKQGHCWTDFGGIVQSFFVRDTQHCQSNNADAKLDDLSFNLSEKVYVPQFALAVEGHI